MTAPRQTHECAVPRDTDECVTGASTGMPDSRHTATHCNTLQHTATHCNTQVRVRGCLIVDTLQHIATHCNALQHTATHCNTQVRVRGCLIVDNKHCAFFSECYQEHAFAPESLLHSPLATVNETEIEVVYMCVLQCFLVLYICVSCIMVQ